MRLSSLIDEGRVLVGIEGETLDEGVSALMGLLEPDLEPARMEAVRKGIQARCAETDDYVGSGVAIPHARVEGLDKFYLCFGSSKKGLARPTRGEEVAPVEKVHLLFVILTPQTQNTLMLQALAAIARLCRNQDTRQALRNCKNRARIVKLIEESDVEVKRDVSAGDVMRPCKFPLESGKDLAEAVNLLIKSGERALPVVDEDGRVCGVLKPADLFKLGMPKYVGLLSDVDLLSSFEPFEQLLVNEKKLTAGDLAAEDVAVVREDAPIMQVAHLMVTKPAYNVFIVDKKDKLAGVIDERDILVRVLQP